MCLTFASLLFQGTLKDGTDVAVKLLSLQSRQGVKEFLNELMAISDISHENLVKLHGCCVEGRHRILVYNYLENNSLAHTLLGSLSLLNPLYSFLLGKICICSKTFCLLHFKVLGKVTYSSTGGLE
jgi:hypothetical protein